MPENSHSNWTSFRGAGQNGPPPGRWQPAMVRRRSRSPSYGAGVVSVLEAVWEAASYPWSLRWKALLPLWMPGVKRRFRVSADVLVQPEMECCRI